MQKPPPGVFTGYASVFGIPDLQADIIIPGAFQKAVTAFKAGRRTPRLLWQHDTSRPIGRILALAEDPRGLKITAQLALNAPGAADAYALLKAGALDGLSVGFRPLKTQPDPARRLRLIREAELWEVSLVTFAANPEARVSAVV